MKCKALLSSLLLLLGLSAAGQSSYTMRNPSGTNRINVFRTGTTDTEETIRYRLVSLSAIEGSHFTGQSGTLTFGPGDTQKSFDISPCSVSNLPTPYILQAGESRELLLELTDLGGFKLVTGTFTFSFGSAYQYSFPYARGIRSKSGVTDLAYFSSGRLQSGEYNKYIDVPFTIPSSFVVGSGDHAGYALIDDSYDYNEKPVTVSTAPVFQDKQLVRNYHIELGDKLYATVYYTVKELYDGYLIPDSFPN